MLVENPKDQKVQDAEFSSFSQTSQPVLASRFKRWLASMINGVILWAILTIGFIFGDFTGFLSILLYLGLQIYFMKTYGQTMAKRWLGLRVFDYQTQQPIVFGKYIGRELIDQLLAWTSFLILISGIVALIRDDRRSLTDLVIGTVVVQDKK
ncbi:MULTISPECIES: RDD family protein [unclassified Pasteurella]|uniref:RDD family protein n=1 Tax=unclassified Pasteurella TaxID=2621516 RepID=UPI0010739A19|nr:RDD family protein [Pasteurella sp. 19428wF3_WM03]TFU50097.1 RDD family protein [Pasteurella sp. WM03]